MIQKFDIFNRYEAPVLTLYNPIGTNKRSLSQAKNVNLTLNFNALSELNFNIDKRIDGIVFENYNQVVHKKIVELKDVGKFIITGVTKSNDGITETKSVTCLSLENELTSKILNSFSGTYKFYDILDNTNTFMGKMLSYLPNWSIGQVDSELLNIYRTFDVTEGTLYNITVDEAEKAYECVFTFDTYNRKINALTVENATKNTDIILTYSNLIKSIDIKDCPEELFTALTVYGGGDLDITTVNPLGTNVIYNFSYYKNLEWMTQGLIDAITIWENKFNTQQMAYATLLTTLKNKNAELLTLKTELVELQIQYTTIEGVQKTRISQNLNYSDINVLLANKQSEINTKNGQIATKQSEISTVLNQLTAIHNDLKFETNFTSDQLKELDNYIIQTTYRDEYIIVTESATYEEIQTASQELYDKAKRALIKLSQMRYTFSLSSINFVFLPEFQKYTSQLELGCQLKVDMDDGLFSYPILLSINLNYDNPTDLGLTFGNKLRLSKEEDKLDMILNEAMKTSSTVGSDSLAWGNYVKNDKGKVNEFINGALDASRNEIVNADNQEIVINANGLRGRQKLENGLYSPKQCWLIGNKLVFSDDGFLTAKAMLGEYTFNGQTYYGVIGEALVGKILISTQLSIANQNNSFMVDSNGATLTNATFTLTTTDGNSKLLLNPTDGIKMQGKVGSVFEDKFYMDGSGNANFKGKITGSEMTGSSAYFGNKAGGTYLGIANDSFLQFFYNNTSILSMSAQSYGRITMRNVATSDLAQFSTDITTKIGTKCSGVTSNGNIALTATGSYKQIQIETVSSLMGITSGGDISINSRNGAGVVYIDGTVSINGDITSYGAKPATIKTDNFGKRQLFAEESDRLYFNTHGISETTGETEFKHVVRLDDIFLETIEHNSKCPYIVQLTPRSNCRIWTKSVFDKYIVIQSDVPTKFDYTIRCTRKDYGDVYLREVYI